MPVRRNANGNWFYRKVLKLPDGTRVKITGTPSRNTREAADQMERAAIDRVLKGEHAVQKKEVPRLAEFEKDFVRVYAMTNNKPSEVASKISTLKHHLVPAFGHLRLDQIGIRQIEEFKARQLNRKAPSRPLDPKTVNNHLTCLRRLLTVVVEWGLIAHVPPIKWLKAPEHKFDFLTFEECERVIAGADDEWRPMITVAAKTGMRLGELLALEWDDVEGGAGGFQSAPAPSRVARLLQRGWWPLEEGGVQVAPLARLQTRWTAPHRVHCLRHTFASHLVMRSAPIKAVQELLGHATIEMTMRYSHLSPDVRRDAVGLLDRRCITVASAEGQATKQAG